MGKSAIEWTDRTWNPVRGCTRVSEGCRFCYAERLSARELPGHASPTTGEPFARMTKGGPRWTGAVELLPHKLDEPLRWRKPARVFVNSMSDLFHEALEFSQISATFGVMADCPHLDFQVLTKRPEVAVEWFKWLHTQQERTGKPATQLCADYAATLLGREVGWPQPWPLPNVWLGVSAEDQETADVRIPRLLQCPAALRFVSYEPALAPVDFTRWTRISWQCSGCREYFRGRHQEICPSCGREGYWTGSHAFNSTGGGQTGSGLDWLIAGGESGPGARPAKADWLRSARDQCRNAGIPFFFKQWGKFAPYSQLPDEAKRELDASGFQLYTDPVPAEPLGLGKKKTGRLLDGRVHDEFPEVSHAA